MWFNQKFSYFLDTFGKQSRYLSKLRSDNTDCLKFCSMAEICGAVSDKVFEKFLFIAQQYHCRLYGCTTSPLFSIFI